MAVPEYSYVTVYFPSQISSVSSGGDTVTESGNQLSVARNDGENACVITCMIENGYKISNAVWAGADEYNNLSVTFENNVITLHDDGQGSKSGSLTITVEQSNPKSVSDSNLARFKEKCDETYAPMSRALPAPAGTTDAGKVPTVNSAGNGYELQTPSGGGAQLYKHSFNCSVGTSGYFCRLDVISVVSTAMTDDEFITELKAGRIISSFLYMSFNPGGPGGLSEWYIQCILNYYGSNLYASYAQQRTFSTDEVVINSMQSTVIAL